MSIPPEKLHQIKNLIKNWDFKTSCTKNQLQSLLGSLLYISKCVKFSRFFLNRLLQTLRDHSKQKIIRLTADFHKDLSWFKSFIDTFNGVTLYHKNSVDGEIHLDACLTGVGAIFGNEVYKAKIPPLFKECHITALEMLNILVAVRQWEFKWSGLVIKIFCDNAAVVTVLNYGKTKDPLLATISRNIFMVCSKFDIALQITHIEGKRNVIADLLSRWSNSDTDHRKLKNLCPAHGWVTVNDNHFLLDNNI